MFLGEIHLDHQEENEGNVWDWTLAFLIRNADVFVVDTALCLGFSPVKMKECFGCEWIRTSISLII